ncbi:hypothetical protein [Desulfobacula phenolica]|uniref:SPFH domain / Band 7 family protein n=1 Tax=Desulfobacula phenolica TaxID=90732 RepID=A0A1H2FF59_9BACT|nr:hypothetical protein [Desulfobacula phenolica]SDU05991.1 hypothetical protein SAMN04487931_104124 [Desulfobacula phenolica]
MINIQPDNLSIYMKQIKEGGGKLSKFLRPGKALKILLVLAAIAYLCFAFLFVYVQPDEYGIKVVRVGLNRGVQKQIYHAGLTFVMPFGLQQMYRLPKGIQVLELTNFPETAAGGPEKTGPHTSRLRMVFL